MNPTTPTAALSPTVAGDEPDVPYIRALLGGLGAIVWEFDWPTGAFTYVSDGVEELLGFPRGDWLRPGFWLEHLHPEDAEWALNYCRSCTDERRDHDFEYRMVHADGSVVWVRDFVLVDPELGTDGRARGLLVSVDRCKRAETELEMQGRRSHELLESVGLFVAEIDADGIIEYLNPTAEHSFGPLVGSGAVNLIPDDARSFVSSMVGAMSEAGALAPIEVDSPAADGSIRTVRWHCYTLADDFGRFAGARAVGEDITEIRVAEERERQYQRRLSKLASDLTMAEDAERRRLAEELHDRVSQSLAVATMHLSVASNADGTVDLAELERGRRMVEDAIRQTRAITTELFPPVLSQLGLGAALRWLCEETQRTQAFTCSAEITLDTSQLDDERSAMLFRMARELVMNVVKHARATRCTIALAETDSYIELSVEDNGCGFDPDADSSSGSSGFGLFSIRDRASHVGGTLDTDTAPGAGTKTTLRVPLRAQIH